MRPEYLVLKPDELHRFGSTATAVFDMYVFELIRFRCASESRRGTYEDGGRVWWRASIEALCVDLGGVSERPVRLALDRLVAGGLLERAKRSGASDRAWSYRPICQKCQSICQMCHLQGVKNVKCTSYIKETSKETRERVGAGERAYEAMADAVEAGDFEPVDGTLIDYRPESDSETLDLDVRPTTPADTGKAATGQVSGQEHASDEALFAEFWAHYPRKAAKGQARTAFKTALKKTDLATLVEATKVFAETRKRDITSGQSKPEFTPYPATWLNGERWEEYTPAAVVEASDSAVDALVAELGVSGAAERLGVAYNVPERIFEIEEPEVRRRAVAEFSSEWLGRNRQRLAERLAG